MKVRAKYTMTAFTSIVAEKDEVLTDEDFVSRLVDAGMSEEDAKATLKARMREGLLIPEDGEPEPEVKDPEGGEPESEPEAKAPAEEKPKPKRGGRPKKQG